jgi:hypothetical protein
MMNSETVEKKRTHEGAEAVRRGHAVYTPLMLSIYDLWVLGISHPLIWRCPTGRLLAHYAAHLTDHHLEAGVGTAYLLDHSKFKSKQPRITLLDLNPNTLRFGARRLRRYKPRTRLCNLLEPIEFDERYTSAALNHVLHCLPGTLETKSVVFKHLKAGVAPGGVIFGATVLAKGVELSRAAQRAMDAYNKKGIFSNTDDSLEGLANALQHHFQRYTIEVAGCIALFAGYC